MADWLSPLDNYCERTGPELFSEPLNAVSNGVFLLAAFLLWRLYRAQGRKDRALAFLILMVGVVGVGSLSFHMFANRLTMLGDVIPIVVLVLSYLAVGFTRLAGYSMGKLMLIYMLFFGSAFALGQLPPEMALNGSLGYVPCLLVLLVMAASCRGTPSGKHLLLSAGVFTLSLTLRTLDMAACGTFSIGTHFLWHCLNGVLLYRLVRVVLNKSVTV